MILCGLQGTYYYIDDIIFSIFNDALKMEAAGYSE